MAASHASTASRSSERPESFENSVAPMPTIAAVSLELVAIAHRGSSNATVPVTWSPSSFAPRTCDLDHAVVLAR